MVNSVWKQLYSVSNDTTLICWATYLTGVKIGYIATNSAVPSTDHSGYTLSLHGKCRGTDTPADIAIHEIKIWQLDFNDDVLIKDIMAATTTCKFW